MILRRSACDRHRPALIDLVDRRARGSATGPALDHLATCARCKAELTRIALTVAALRRAGRSIRAAPVPRPEAAAVVRLTRPSLAWRPRLSLAGLVTSAAIVALVTGPQLAPGSGLAPPRQPPRDAFFTYGVVVGWRIAEMRTAATAPISIEASVVDARPDGAAVEAVDARPGSVPPRYPDRLLGPLTEVPSAESMPRIAQPR